MASARRLRLRHNRSASTLTDAPLPAQRFIRPDQTNVLMNFLDELQRKVPTSK